MATLGPALLRGAAGPPRPQQPGGTRASDRSRVSRDARIVHQAATGVQTTCNYTLVTRVPVGKGEGATCGAFNLFGPSGEAGVPRVRPW